MKNKKKDVGFNRKVKASWLKDTLQMTAAGVPVGELEESLKNKISIENPGKETVRKVFIYLRRVWINPPEYCIKLRDDGLEMFRKRPDADIVFLLNWGMCIAAYPFIGHVADATGRLFRLQGEAHARQVNQRIREKFGDRHFVYRSVRYNLSTFLDLGAVRQGSKNGIYLKGKKHFPKTDIEKAWLIEALLHAQDETSLPFSRLSQHSALFPFDMGDLSIAAIVQNPRVEVFRHGLNDELVGLAE